MTLAELEAALAWLERNRLSDHLNLLQGDSRYAWTAARRRRPVWQQLDTPSEPKERDARGPDREVRVERGTHQV
jgi:hypothetical protein